MHPRLPPASKHQRRPCDEHYFPAEYESDWSSESILRLVPTRPAAGIRSTLGYLSKEISYWRKIRRPEVDAVWDNLSEPTIDEWIAGDRDPVTSFLEMFPFRVDRRSGGAYEIVLNARLNIAFVCMKSAVRLPLVAAWIAVQLPTPVDDARVCKMRRDLCHKTTGRPDLILRSPGRLVAVEMKVEGGKSDTAQFTKYSTVAALEGACHDHPASWTVLAAPKGRLEHCFGAVSPERSQASYETLRDTWLSHEERDRPLDRLVSVQLNTIVEQAGI